ncbi:MAG: deoxyribonuclease IV [Gemmatimonadota bacterium]|nr:MAG: deoxyribonuclease IV [Gemmatimonadota bacterium]
MRGISRELLGAHVSTAGGVASAPARGREIGATAIQIFTKTPNQWREPSLSAAEIARFKSELKRNKIGAVVAHDSYLINLASPDAAHLKRSITAYKSELRRCKDLGIPFLVTHPGNHMGDRDAGLRRNAAAFDECLAAISGPMVLIETAAGAGTALGSTFKELGELRQMVADPLRERIGFCADTCHLYSAGYDLVNDWDGTWREWDRTVGLHRLFCLHLNDSKTPLGSRRDRHALIAEGCLGPEPFRKVMLDQRFRGIIKVIETPKGDHPERQDRRMLRRLRAYGRRAHVRRPT